MYFGKKKLCKSCSALFKSFHLFNGRGAFHCFRHNKPEGIFWFSSSSSPHQRWHRWGRRRQRRSCLRCSWRRRAGCPPPCPSTRASRTPQGSCGPCGTKVCVYFVFGCLFCVLKSCSFFIEQFTYAPLHTASMGDVFIQREWWLRLGFNPLPRIFYSVQHIRFCKNIIFILFVRIFYPE